MLKLPTASARSFAKVIRVQPITKKAISTKYTPNASINTTPGIIHQLLMFNEI